MYKVTSLLNRPVTTIKGIGPKAGEQFAKIGIETIEDLVMTFPYRHEDLSLGDLAETPHNEKVTVEARVESEPTVQFLGPKRSRLQVRLLVGPHLVRAVFFNQHYLKNRLTPGKIVTVSGKWDRGRQSLNVSKFSDGPQQQEDYLEPVYSLKGVMHQKTFRRYLRNGLDALQEEGIEDVIPEPLLRAYKLPTMCEALEMLHFPQHEQHMKQARRRFVYEELLLFQLNMQAMKKLRKDGEKGSVIHYDLDRLKAFIDTLPFELTSAQKRVVKIGRAHV